MVMFITKVELENIKSYRHARVEFRQGTTAIRGENGAGKTTLVEAIGFALFNYLPYSQAQFVREGERSGQVTVSFIIDDHEYQVVRRCGASSAWYIFDPQLEVRLVDQGTDVIDWLREHLSLQGELKLDAFFSDALGVPQGTFTSDFLAAPANRKRKFDALLQVEDYRRAYDKLRDTVSHLDNEARDLKSRVEGLEKEAGAIEALRQELERLREEEHATIGQLMTTETERDQAEQRRADLQRLSDEVNRLKSANERAKSEWEGAKQALAQAVAALDKARAARCALEESASAHALFLQAEADLQGAREQERTQQELLARQAAYQQELATARRDEEHAAKRLAEAEAARQQMAELAPQVDRQTALEQEISEARQQATRLQEIGREITRLEADCARLAEDLERQARRLAEIEARRPEAALLAERRAEVERLNVEVQRRADRTRDLEQVRESLRGLDSDRAKNEIEVEKHRQNVAKLLATRPLVETLPALEAEWNELCQQVMLLQGNIKRHNESKLQSAGGHCPFLREPCLNIQQKGLSSLETYFDRLIARDQAALAPLEGKQVGLEKQVQDVRLKKSYVDRLDEFEQYLSEAQERQEKLRGEAKRLAGRERELVEQLDAADESAQRLTEAQALLQSSDEADKQVRTLEGLASQYEQQQRYWQAQVQTLERLRSEQAVLADVPARLETLAQELSALGDPRRAYAHQESIAGQQQEAGRQLAAAQRLIVRVEAALAALRVELAPYAGLKARIDDLTQQQQQSRAGYDTYLKNEQMASELPGCQAAHAALSDAEQQARERYAAAAQRYDQVAAGFTSEVLQEAEDEFVRLANLVGELKGHLRRVRDDLEKQQQQICAAEAKQAELEKVKAEQQEITETREMLQQFRETIKNAGPHVMKELQRQISRDANRIFGEILGDHAAELAWEDDYEIVLRSKGQIRTFAQLSGGEQMSAALAVRLALLKKLARLDVAFFDEPTQNMDERRRGNLAEQIKRVRGFNQLIVISHDDTFEQGLDSVVHLHKRAGETIVGVNGLGTEDLALVGSIFEDGL
jgi:exonuclease SbcC